MSGENLTQSAENATGSEEEGQETFHIYILSFSYGFLLVRTFMGRASPDISQDFSYLCVILSIIGGNI